jgi:hypothetical protein
MFVVHPAGNQTGDLSLMRRGWYHKTIASAPERGGATEAYAGFAENKTLLIKSGTAFKRWTKRLKGSKAQRLKTAWILYISIVTQRFQIRN